ncbi:MAG: hypothetical protein COB15_00830 [Flavobacteriales bacterium]|nr:MAG: hypothetical protein COB15_00830 [Flavobacteriales bacterium]
MRINKLVTALFLLLIVNTTVFSQATTNSPYSKYGIGVVRTQAFTQGFGMGGVGVGLRTYKDINLQNPASYSAISVVTFDVGYTNNALTLDDGTETQYQNNSYLDHISLAFPVVKNVWGMSFGVLPYSNVGYKYDEVINDPIAGNISFYNEGSGGVNKAYLGNALAVKVDSTSNISLGVNANFLFGSINHDQRAIYGDLANAYNVWKVRDYSVADFGFDFGLQYQKTFTNSDDEKYKLTIGATYGLASGIKTKRTEIIRSFSGTFDFGTIKDTIEFIEEVEDVIQLPSELGFGVSLEKDNKWLLAVDYKVSNWGAIESNDDLYTYQSNSSFAFGAQFIPKHDGSNYLQRVAYRIGSRYSNSYLTINEVDFSEYGITFGIGLPVRRAENSYPRLNFGFEYGNKGTTEAGLIQEKFFNMNVGVTINATWFRKRKYD